MAADIRHGLDVLLGEQIEEFGFGASGVSDRPDAVRRDRTAPP
jgi:hypothetical protein